jgi:hypothetical protein
VSGQFSYGNLIRRFLKLDNLLVDETRLLMGDKVGVHRTFWRWVVGNSASTALSGKSDTCEATKDRNVLSMPTVATLDMKLCCLR